MVSPASKQSSTLPNGSHRSALDMESQVRNASLDALEASGVIQNHEKTAFDNYLVSTNSPVSDLLPIMADLRKVAEDQKIETIQRWGRSISQGLKKRYSFIPFGSRLLNPTNFYEKYPEIYDWCQTLKVAVLYAEDADCVGLGL